MGKMPHLTAQSFLKLYIPEQLLLVFFQNGGVVLQEEELLHGGNFSVESILMNLLPNLPRVRATGIMAAVLSTAA